MRRADPRIAEWIHRGLGTAISVINVGAVQALYEPDDLRGHRRRTVRVDEVTEAAGRPPALDAIAEDLPFPDDSFDAAMATVTVHQWSDQDTGERTQTGEPWTGCDLDVRR